MVRPLYATERIPLANPHAFLINLRSNIEWRSGWPGLFMWHKDFYGDVTSDHFLLRPTTRFARRSPFRASGRVLTASNGVTYLDIAYNGLSWVLFLTLPVSLLGIGIGIMIVARAPVFGILTVAGALTVGGAGFVDFFVQKARLRRLVDACNTSSLQEDEPSAVAGIKAPVQEITTCRVGSVDLGPNGIAKIVSWFGIPIKLRTVPLKDIESFSTQTLIRHPRAVRAVFFHPSTKHFLKYTPTGFALSEMDVALLRNWAEGHGIPEGDRPAQESPGA